MRRTTIVAAAAAAAALGAPASAQAWSCPGAVDFKVKGTGQLMTEPDALQGGERAPFAGTKLSTKSGFYYADGVTVVYRMRRVKFVARPGAVFKPHCFATSANRYRDSPSLFLESGRAFGRASSRSPRVNGITTYEGAFYTTVKRRHRYTVSRTHPAGDSAKGRSVLSVLAGDAMTITPFSDVAAPGSCKPGKSVSIDHRGRIRASG